MPEYEIECRGDAREVYGVIADDEDAARELFERGDAGRPLITECSGMEVVSVVRRAVGDA